MGTYRLKIIFFICSLGLFFPFSSNTILGKDFVVVIDPGHGGNDPGAIGKSGREKDINLRVALRLGELINANSTNTKVIFTRSNDIFIPLDRRAEIANNAKADLFISIHTNAVARNGQSISGAETYTLGLHRSEENLEVAKRENSVILVENDYKQRYAGFNPNSSESYIMFEFLQDKNMENSVLFAKRIQSSFKNNVGRTDRGVHQAGFLVLRATSMPSVLVELGYISNANEEQYLISNEGASSMASGIFKAFMTYKRSYDSKAKLAVAEDKDEKSEDIIIDVNNSASVEKEIVSAKDSDKNVVSYPYPTSSNKKSNILIDNNKQNNNRRDVDVVKDKKSDNTKEQKNESKDKPVFKIQIAASNQLLKEKDRAFKGYAPIDYYKENGTYKYTYQSDTDYNKILKISREVRKVFKDAFIIAFKNGEKIDVNEAVKEFKDKRD